MRSRRGLILALLLGLASCAAPEPETRLVLLVTVDTLRADRLGAYGSERNLTPHLDAFAARSVVFQSAYSASAHTLPSIASIMTGRFPEELGIWSNLSVLPSDTPTLTKAFAAAGWNTSAVVSSWILRTGSGLSVGFGSYDNELPQQEVTRPIPERVGDETTRAALAALDTCLPDAAARCFLWVHYQDPHGPYTPPAGLRERHLARERAEPDGRRLLRPLADNFGGDGVPIYQRIGDELEVAFYRAGYDGEVEFMDQEVGRLLARVGELGLEEQAVIVFTADHGEALGEDEYWFAHGEYLSEELVRVPLIVHASGLEPGGRDDLVAPVDLWPTLSSLVLEGADPPPGPGRELFAPAAADANSEPYLATLSGSNTPRFGFVDPRFKYVASHREDVWDSRLTRRGADAPDLTAPAPGLAAEMRERLIGLMERYRLHEEENRVPIGEEGLRQLEALGYIDRSAKP